MLLTGTAVSPLECDPLPIEMSLSFGYSPNRSKLHPNWVPGIVIKRKCGHMLPSQYPRPFVNDKSKTSREGAISDPPSNQKSPIRHLETDNCRRLGSLFMIRKRSRARTSVPPSDIVVISDESIPFHG